MQDINKVLEKSGISKNDLIKSLENAGQRESALLLQNWNEFDHHSAEEFKKAKDIAGDTVDSKMLMSELESLEHHIEEIKQHLSASDVAPDWVKSKISQAAGSMSDIAHYVMGTKEKISKSKAESTNTLDYAAMNKKPKAESTNTLDYAAMNKKPKAESKTKPKQQKQSPSNKTALDEIKERQIKTAQQMIIDAKKIRG
jgi:hypothetical protein